MPTENNGISQAWKLALHSAFPHTLPVLTGFLFLGMAYGILMQTKGYGTVWAVLMSAVGFCGSMQFAALPLLTSAFDPLAALVLSIMVNARHLFYGLSMLDKYKGLGRLKFPLIFTLCDETFSLVSSITPPPGVVPKYFYLSISVLDYLYWVGGSFLGGALGSLLTFNTKGLDFVLTALFVVLFWEQMQWPPNRFAGLAGLAASAAAVWIFGAANMVIPAMILVVLILLGGRGRLCD